MNLGKSEITAPHCSAGLDDQISSSWRGSVFLDIPFYRTGLSDTGFTSAERQPSSTGWQCVSEQAEGYRGLVPRS